MLQQFGTSLSKSCHHEAVAVVKHHELIRGVLQAASRDLQAAQKLDPGYPDLQKQLQRLQHLSARSKQGNAALLQQMMPGSKAATD